MIFKGNMVFFVPYNLILDFSRKENGVYRHTLAHRVYLLLIFFKSGRIGIGKKKDIIAELSTSHSALNKALAYLERRGLVKIGKGYIEAKGYRSFGTSPYNVKFQFNLDDLKSAKAFTNKIFSCLFQMSAMRYGKRRTSHSLLFPPEKLHCDSVTLKGEVEKDYFSSLSYCETVEFIQEQSSFYLSKLIDRHPQSIYNRQKSIQRNNVPLQNPNVAVSYYRPVRRTVLTEKGFNTKDYSPVIHFQTSSEAFEYLKARRHENPQYFQGTYVMAANHGGYSIVKPLPTVYQWKIPVKEIFKNFDFRYRNKQKEYLKLLNSQTFVRVKGESDISLFYNDENDERNNVSDFALSR